MTATVAIILIITFVIYANKTDSVYSNENYNDKHKNDIDIIIEDFERDLEKNQ